LLAGCAATSTAVTYSDPAQASAQFRNFLVAGVALDYDSRAQYERAVVSALRAEGASASAYHAVVGGNKPLTREAVREAVAANGFDAVIVTRVLDTTSDVELRSTVTGTKVSRKEGGPMHLFRYDYEELDDPVSLSVDIDVTMQTDLYSVTTRDVAWSAESTSRHAENVGAIIDETAESVVRQLKRAGKIAD
jgi:hypothetical protein